MDLDLGKTPDDQLIKLPNFLVDKIFPELKNLVTDSVCEKRLKS